MSKIVIGVACHKPFEMPDNDLYLPINVGAALREATIPGTQPDNEGDNISVKNPQYCELTAQYWLWKNVDADYYGLCHYRRFLSFAPTRFDNFTHDNRKQVLVPELNDASKAKYHLEDMQGMRDIIESCDIVAPDEQDLSHVYTPHGHKRSVYKHFAAHDHDLINVHDLDAMIEIVREKYPQYAADMDEYLSGPAFRGFNCFVMKRDLFFELCEYEFDVLAELEQRIDMDTYDVMRTRVYGFMAEIISSSFIYHKSKMGQAKVHDVQMLYFGSTDPIVPLTAWPNSKTVVVNAIGIVPCVFAVTLRSIADTIDPNLRYDLIVAHNETLTKYYRAKFKELLAECENVRLSYLDWSVKGPSFEDTVGYTEFIGGSLRCALPWILPDHERAVVFDWNVLFKKGWSDLFTVDLEGNVVGATIDVEWVGSCNGVYRDTRDYVRHFLGITEYLKLASCAVTVMDLAVIRSIIDPADLMCVLSSFERALEPSESFNVIFENSIKFLDTRYGVRQSTDYRFERRIGDLPLEIAEEYRRACKDPVIIDFDHDEPFWGDGEAVVMFWELARRSPFYEIIHIELINNHVAAGKQGRNALSRKRRVFNGLAPEGSQRRQLIRKLIPWNSGLARRMRSVIGGM